MLKFLEFPPTAEMSDIIRALNAGRFDQKTMRLGAILKLHGSNR